MNPLRACVILAASSLALGTPAEAADPPPPPPVETEKVTEVRIIGVRGTPADSLEQVGFAAYSDGVYEDAEDAFLDAIAEARRGTGGRSKTSLAQLHSNLAWLYLETGRRAEADSVMRQAIAFERDSDAEPLVLARRSIELAMLRQLAGRHADALPLLDEVLEVQAKHAKKADAREVAFTLHLLARNYHATGDSKQSESFYQKALAGLDETQTMDQSQWAATMLDLAELYHATHRDREAREAFDKALKKANDLYAAGGLPNALVLNPYSVLLRRAEAVRATSDSSAH